MHDPLKDFVNEHRSAFDSVEPPLLDLARVLPRVQKDTAKQKKLPLQYMGWAASIVVMLGIGILVFNQQTAIQIEPSLADNAKILAPEIKLEKEIEQQKEEMEEQITENLHFVQNTRNNVDQNSKNNGSLRLEGLSDSTSASTRLLSILNLEKSGKLNLELAGKIAKTMDQDGNTNVRLAALNLLNQHKQKAYVSELLIQSLDTQNDPMVQLGLINSIGKSNNPLVNQRLLQIVERPTTFAMVRDEAYLLLMTHNAL